MPRNTLFEPLLEPSASARQSKTFPMCCSLIFTIVAIALLCFVTSTSNRVKSPVLTAALHPIMLWSWGNVEDMIGQQAQQVGSRALQVGGDIGKSVASGAQEVGGAIGGQANQVGIGALHAGRVIGKSVASGAQEVGGVIGDQAQDVGSGALHVGRAIGKNIARGAQEAGGVIADQAQDVGSGTLHVGGVIGKNVASGAQEVGGVVGDQAQQVGSEALQVGSVIGENGVNGAVQVGGVIRDQAKDVGSAAILAGGAMKGATEDAWLSVTNMTAVRKDIADFGIQLQAGMASGSNAAMHAWKTTSALVKGLPVTAKEAINIYERKFTTCIGNTSHIATASATCPDGSLFINNDCVNKILTTAGVGSALLLPLLFGGGGLGAVVGTSGNFGLMAPVALLMQNIALHRAGSVLAQKSIQHAVEQSMMKAYKVAHQEVKDYFTSSCVLVPEQAFPIVQGLCGKDGIVRPGDVTEDGNI